MKKKPSHHNTVTEPRLIECGDIIRMPYWQGDLNTHLCVLLQVEGKKNEPQAMLFSLQGANRVDDKKYTLRHGLVPVSEIAKTSKILENDIKVVGRISSLLKNFKEAHK